MKKFQNHKAKNGITKERKNIVLHASSELYNDLTEIDLDRCNKIWANKKEINIVLIIYGWMTMAIHLMMHDVPPTSRLKSHKENIKERTGIKISAPNKLLTRIPVL